MDRSRTYQAAGITLAAAAGVGVIANALHPRFDSATYNDPAAYVAEIDGSAVWLVDHLAILGAIIGLVIGLVALASHLAEEDKARPWALASAVTTLAIGGAALVTIVIDGLVLPTFAATLGSAPEGAAAVVAVDLGMFSSLGLLAFGVAPMVLGMALVRSELYPHWTGFVALASGVFGIVTGVIVAIQATIPTVATVTFLIATIPWTLTLVVLGAHMRRFAMETVPGHLPGATAA